MPGTGPLHIVGRTGWFDDALPRLNTHRASAGAGSRTTAGRSGSGPDDSDDRRTLAQATGLRRPPLVHSLCSSPRREGAIMVARGDEFMTDDSTNDPWVDIEPTKEGLVVECRLCGIGARRALAAEGVGDGDVARTADAYVVDHVRCAAHRAAIHAYNGPPANWMTPEEIRVARLLDASEHELRLFAARNAAANPPPEFLD
jgi:hypothetical protein